MLSEYRKNNPEVVKQYVKAAILKFQQDLKLNCWDIRWRVEEVEGSAESSCRVNPTYYTISISFDPAKVRNARHLKATVVHELLHAVVSQYEITTNKATEQLSPQASELMESVLDTELERTVSHLEAIITPLLSDPILEEE